MESLLYVITLILFNIIDVLFAISGLLMTYVFILWLILTPSIIILLYNIVCGKKKLSDVFSKLKYKNWNDMDDAVVMITGFFILMITLFYFRVNYYGEYPSLFDRDNEEYEDSYYWDDREEYEDREYWEEMIRK